MEKIKVAVLFGGQSTEHAVSLQSACAERARQIFSGEIRWAKPSDTVCL